MTGKLIMAENRMKMHAKETPWGKYLRLNELARHRARCRKMKPSIDNSPPRQGPQQIMNRERSNLEQVLGGAANWIGKYEKSVKKLTDCRPWSVPKVAKTDLAPFSTLKIQPRDDKMRVIEKSIMDHRQRISKIQKGPSVYQPRKKTYLSRGEAPWNHRPAGIHTVDEKLKDIRKWAMRRRPKTTPAAPTGIMAYLPAMFFSPEPEPDLAPISTVTEEDAARDAKLAQLKKVQEAGDSNF